MNDYTASERAVFIWRSFPQICRQMVVAMVLSWLGCLIVPALFTIVALIPKMTLHLCLWNVLTYPLAESSLLSLLMNAVCLLLIGRMVEPVWGYREFLRFSVIVSVCTGISILALSLIVSVVGSSTWLIDYYCGITPLLAGCSPPPPLSFCQSLAHSSTSQNQKSLTVALKQLMPEHELHFWFIPIRLKNLPSVLVVLSLILDVFQFADSRVYVSSGAAAPASLGAEMEEPSLSDMTPLPRRAGSALLVLFGVYFSWLYLRFYQAYLQNDIEMGTRGDPSEFFAFSTFFPVVLQPWAKLVANRSFAVCSGPLRLLPSTSEGHHLHDPASVVTSTEIRNTQHLDEEARRKAAVAALQRAEASGVGMSGSRTPRDTNDGDLL